MARSKGRTGRPWRRAREALRAKRLPCHICGQSIDYSLPSHEPRSFVADHVDPLAYGGDVYGIAPAHRECNGRRGTKAVRDVVVLPRSREW